MIGLPERDDRICIVDSNGSIARSVVTGSELRFNASEQGNADRLCLAMNSIDGNAGRYSVLPLIGEP